MKLTVQALQRIFGTTKVTESTYYTNQGTRIRLINTNPEDASVPALYPNENSYRRHLVKFENVKTNRIDYILGTSHRLANRKTDLQLEPTLQLPPLGIEASND